MHGLAADKLVIRHGHHHAVGGSEDMYAKKFAELVKAKSNGAIEVKVMPGAQLGQEGEAGEGIHLGTLQSTVCSSPFFSKYVKEMGIDYLPFVWVSWDHAAKALNGDAGAQMNKRLAAVKSNVKILAWHQIGFRNMLLVKKRVKSLDDLKGLKMRSPESKFFISMFRSLGAKPTPITWGEVYTALQTGVVDGMECPYQSGIDMKFVEVAKHWTETKHMFSNMPHVVNEKWYNGLSPEHQKYLLEAAREAAKWSSAREEKKEKDVKDRLAKMGCTFDEVDIKPFRERMTQVYDEFYKSAPEGKALMELIIKDR
jgi:tripartite ATP-independent transporter DctP family solute receptor